MKVTLLGTGDSPGTPVIGCHCRTCQDARKHGWQRRRFSVLIQADGKNILVDTSPDLRSQLLRLDIDRIDAVIWTHCHYDHFAGFGEFYRVQSNVTVYSSPEVHEDIGRFMHFMKYRRIEVEPYEPFELFDVSITLFDVTHPPLRRAHGLLVEKDGYRVVISGDTNMDIPAESIRLMMDADLLLVDAIAPEGYRLKKHMNAGEAMELSKKLRAKDVYFVHLGHFYPPHRIAVKKYPLAHDFQSFTFGEGSHDLSAFL